MTSGGRTEDGCKSRLRQHGRRRGRRRGGERRDEIIGGQGVIEASRRVYHPERDQVLQ